MSTVPVDADSGRRRSVYRDVKSTALTRVLNTRPLILKDASGRHYLKIFDGWMEAPALAGPWTVATKLPGDCEKALKVVVDEKVADMLVGGDPNDPKTAPSLKKQVAAHPRRNQAGGTARVRRRSQVRADSGHEADVRREYDGASVHRRGRSAGVYPGLGPLVPRTVDSDGAWAFVAGDQLPKDFAQIPDDSAKENVKASVPGTEQAEEAVIANSLPQTAQVKRSAATFTSQ